MIEEKINIINLFCKVNEYRNRLKIEKDESYRSKLFLAPTKYFIFFCFLYLYTSITVFLMLRSSLSFNVLIIPIICYVGSYWFYIKYLFYKGRFIKIKIDKITRNISFQQIFPCYERLQKVNVSDIESIMVWRENCRCPK